MQLLDELLNLLDADQRNNLKFWNNSFHACKFLINILTVDEYYNVCNIHLPPV